MQEALRDRSLEEEGNLVNRVIRESIESDERIKQAAREDVLRFTQNILDETEEKIEQTFQAVLGSLAEEASSEIVQKELEAMTRAVAETLEDLTEQAEAFNSSLEHISADLSGVELSRDTKKEDLNAVLARYPKTGEIKG
jgi:hypothetical protein